MGQVRKQIEKPDSRPGGESIIASAAELGLTLHPERFEAWQWSSGDFELARGGFRNRL